MNGHIVMANANANKIETQVANPGKGKQVANPGKGKQVDKAKKPKKTKLPNGTVRQDN